MTHLFTLSLGCSLGREMIDVVARHRLWSTFVRTVWTLPFFSARLSLGFFHFFFLSPPLSPFSSSFPSSTPSSHSSMFPNFYNFFFCFWLCAHDYKVYFIFHSISGAQREQTEFALLFSIASLHWLLSKQIHLGGWLSERPRQERKQIVHCWQWQILGF